MAFKDNVTVQIYSQSFLNERSLNVLSNVNHNKTMMINGINSKDEGVNVVSVEEANFTGNYDDYKNVRFIIETQKAFIVHPGMLIEITDSGIQKFNGIWRVCALSPDRKKIYVNKKPSVASVGWQHNTKRTGTDVSNINIKILPLLKNHAETANSAGITNVDNWSYLLKGRDYSEYTSNYPYFCFADSPTSQSVNPITIGLRNYQNNNRLNKLINASIPDFYISDGYSIIVSNIHNRNVNLLAIATHSKDLFIVYTNFQYLSSSPIPQINSSHAYAYSPFATEAQKEGLLSFRKDYTNDYLNTSGKMDALASISPANARGSFKSTRTVFNYPYFYSPQLSGLPIRLPGQVSFISHEPSLESTGVHFYYENESVNNVFYTLVAPEQSVSSAPTIVSLDDLAWQMPLLEKEWN